MSAWDGRGLPPSATARVQRAEAGVRTSLLDVPSAVALAGAGLAPLGDVMSGMVQHLGWQGFGGCGFTGNAGRVVRTGAGSWTWSGAPTTTVSSSGSPWVGFRPYVDALYRGYDTALARLLGEATALGADGVVGVRLTAEHADAGNREFVALGTAVRAAPPARTATPRPFVTDLAGADVAKLLHAGWVPVAIAVGISVAVRHDDYATQQQSRRWAGNTEVSGYTELVQHVRADARARFAARVARTGADGAVVSSMDLRIREHEPYENHSDHVAESTVVGTAVARFAAPSTPRTSTLTVLPLRRD